jgi:hypothetical protein
MSDDSTCSVFRSSVDYRVWMCNVPYTDVADGIQAACSLRAIKTYVEKTAARWLEFTDGVWTKIDPDYWHYQPREERTRCTDGETGQAAAD